MTSPTVEPTVKGYIHCPAIDCPHRVIARSAAAAHAALEDHIVRVHGSLAKSA